MSPERQYNEEQVAAIFKQATADQESAQRQLPHGGGLHLAELKQTGEEAGITPEYIARAAATLDRIGPILPPATSLGFPVSVARTVELPGPLSDEAWDRLVADLRETFQATGEVRNDGSLRQWRNGNLHALIEPTDSGHRLHLRTLNGNARSALLGGLVFFAMNLAFMLITVVSSGMDAGALLLALLTTIGLCIMGVAAYQLPRWRAERARQMEAIAARAIELAGAPPAVPGVEDGS